MKNVLFVLILLITAISGVKSYGQITKQSNNYLEVKTTIGNVLFYYSDYSQRTVKVVFTPTGKFVKTYDSGEANVNTKDICPPQYQIKERAAEIMKVESCAYTYVNCEHGKTGIIVLRELHNNLPGKVIDELEYWLN